MIFYQLLLLIFLQIEANCNEVELQRTRPSEQAIPVRKGAVVNSTKVIESNVDHLHHEEIERQVDEEDDDMDDDMGVIADGGLGELAGEGKAVSYSGRKRALRRSSLKLNQYKRPRDYLLYDYHDKLKKKKKKGKKKKKSNNMIDIK